MVNKKIRTFDDPEIQRIWDIFDVHLGISQRAFATSLGMHPTSLSSIFKEKNPGKVTPQLRMAISFKYGYKIEWIETGALPMRQIGDKEKTEEAYLSMLGHTIKEELSDETQLSHIKHGLLSEVDNELGHALKRLGKRNTQAKQTKRSNKLDSLRQERMNLILKIEKKLSIAEQKVLWLLFYRVFFMEEEFKELTYLDVGYSYFNLEEPKIKKDVFPLADQLIQIVWEMYEVVEW